MRLPGSSARWYTTIDVLSWPVGAGTPSRADDDEAGLVAVVVGDVARQHARGRRARRRDRRARSPPPRAPGRYRPDGPPRPSSWPRAARRPGSVRSRNARHCAVAHRDRHDGLHVAERQCRPAPAGTARRRARPRAGSAGRASKARASWLRLHRALDGVLDRHEAEIDHAGLDGAQHVGDRRQVDQLGRRQIGLGEERLLGERAERPEEADPRAACRRAAGFPGTGWQDSDVDADALRALLDDVRRRPSVAAGRAAPPASGSRSPTSATPASTTTGPCGRACPRPSTGRARPRSSAPAS